MKTLVNCQTIGKAIEVLFLLRHTLASLFPIVSDKICEENEW